LKENDSYAQQSVAHNTVIVDETSHYGGQWKKGEEHSPELVFSDITNPEKVQIVSAKENNAYAGVGMQRTVAMVGADMPFIIDVYSLRSAQKHNYDLNFMYGGHIIETDFKYDAALTSLTPLGTKNGYQHVWKVAEGTGNNGISKFTWLNDKKFYSIATLTTEATKLAVTKVGANDPDFNLRAENGYMARVQDKGNYTFVSIIEPHGSFDPRLELVQDSHSRVQDIKLLVEDEKYTAVSVSFREGKTYLLMFANAPSDAKTSHKLTIGGQNYTWKGNYQLITK
ncbi:MAG: heparinase, partial [Sphingobacteriales bacterium]